MKDGKEKRFKCQVITDTYESYKLTRSTHMVWARSVYIETAVKGYISTGYVLLAVSSGDERPFICASLDTT
jgi:hypothetical protein